MAIEAVIWQIHGHTRSNICARAMHTGIRLAGDRPTIMWQHTFKEPVGDVAVFYGFTYNLPFIMQQYIAAGKKVLYIDLGYWGRLAGGKLYGYHKIALNARHPTAYFQRKPKDNRRINGFDLEFKPWRQSGDYILLAGMGDKAARAEGFEIERWERETIRAIQAVTDRRIVYRPKPSWKGARPISGVLYSHPKTELESALQNCHAVVTHHSNVAVDAVLAGVPVFAWAGVGSVMGLNDLTRIESPIFPEGREQWVNDISYCQWTVDEMHRGLPWRHMKEEGLV